MTDQENVQAIRVAYLALETGNAAKMLAVCTDDVAWIYPGSETLVPVASEIVGGSVSKRSSNCSTRMKAFR